MMRIINHILEELKRYLDRYYVEEGIISAPKVDSDMQKCDHSLCKKAWDDSGESIMDLEEMLDELGESFQEMLFRKIDERGMTYVEVYKRAGIDRRLSSKIKNNPEYHPSKTLVIQLAISLRLSMKETIDLLSTAEYAFSASNKRDIVIQFFIDKGIYDLDTINYCLYEYELPLLADPKIRND